MTIAEFYRSEWGGIFDGTDEELTALLRHAETVVDEAVMMSGVTVSAAPEKLRDRLYMAVCAQADSIEAAGGIYALSEFMTAAEIYQRISYGIRFPLALNRITGLMKQLGFKYVRSLNRRGFLVADA